MTFKNWLVLVGILIILVIGVALGVNFKPKLELETSATHPKETQPLMEKFNLLNQARTNLCAGPDFLDSKKDEGRLQGSCCSPMDFHHYTEQIEGLKKYSPIGKIPPDPYDIAVSLAKELLEFQKNIKLSRGQQTIYDEAIKLSKEGGPCCCKCWRWYAFEGLAKYLITKYSFTAQQIAEVWELEDGCGGESHTH